MKDRPLIKVLDEKTIHLIAAGEVVEGPSSVVKELVENAIDARAGRILIELTSYKGKIATIRVSDDGIGMGRDDVSLAFVPHATSKIRNPMDILSCATLGFRGEALASIAAVSQVTLITRLHEDSSGTEVVVRGGEVLVVKEKGASRGNRVYSLRICSSIRPSGRSSQRASSRSSPIFTVLSKDSACRIPEQAFASSITGGNVSMHHRRRT